MRLSRTTLSNGVARLAVGVAAFLPGAAFAADNAEVSPTVLIGALSAGVLVCVALVAMRRAVGLLVTALYGAGLAAYLAHHHREAVAGGSSICNISSVINCDAVNTSRYAEVAGVPIAVLGFGFYVAVAFLAVKHLRAGAEARPSAPAMIAALSVLAVGYDLFLGYASYSLGAICVVCATTWAVNLTLLVGGTLAARGGSAAEAVRSESGGVLIAFLSAVIAANLVVGGPGGPAAVALPGGGEAPAPADLSTMYEQPSGVVTLDGTEPMKGDPNARFTLVEWADFQCPHCALMFPVMEEIVAENKDVKIYFRHYPISQACNQFVEGLRHENACQAAAASECARLQGRFWELAGQMFKNQEYLGKDDLRFMVEQTGLDAKAFESCMQDPATAQAIVADVEAGGAAKINGTPSIFLKGAFGDQWVRVIGGKEAINAVLAAARSGAPLPPPPAPNPDR